MVPILQHTDEKALLTTPSNDPVNDLALLVRQTLDARNLGDRIVIRLLSEASEQRIVGK